MSKYAVKRASDSQGKRTHAVRGTGALLHQGTGCRWLFMVTRPLTGVHTLTRTTVTDAHALQHLARRQAGKMLMCCCRQTAAT
jgi:hypothetical protein